MLVKVKVNLAARGKESVVTVPVAAPERLVYLSST
jgi:hypothetical protein